MKRTISLAALVVLATTSVAAARPRPGRGKRFEANKTFGLGLELGAPFGLTGKYFISPDRAIDFGVGDIDYYYGDRFGLHLYIDHLWHPVTLVTTEPFELPLYFGIGARLWDFDEHAPDGEHAYALGVRAPVGIAFDFNEIPIDIFVQLTPVLDVLFNYRRDFLFDIEGSVGIRYYFN